MERSRIAAPVAWLACGIAFGLLVPATLAQAPSDLSTRSTSTVAADHSAKQEPSLEDVMTPALIVAMTITVTPGMLQFVARVHDYVETHRRAAAGIEQPLCADPEVLAAQSDELAAAIRDARPRAKEGDIFTFAVSEMFKTRIARIVRRANVDVAAYLAREYGEGDELELHVFGTLPWRSRVALMPVIRDLPELPPELEYRFVGRHLVLMDVGANMVVDVLRDALAAPAETPRPPRTPCDAHPELETCWM